MVRSDMRGAGAKPLPHANRRFALSAPFGCSPPGGAALILAPSAPQSAWLEWTQKQPHKAQMTAGIEARIKAQEEKLKQLKAQKQQMEARKRAAAAKITRQQDTRRKVLAGAMVLDLMERDEGNRQRFMQRLDSYLTRPDDRALFDLPEKATTAPVAGAGASA